MLINFISSSLSCWSSFYTVFSVGIKKKRPTRRPTHRPTRHPMCWGTLSAFSNHLRLKNTYHSKPSVCASILNWIHLPKLEAIILFDQIQKSKNDHSSHEPNDSTITTGKKTEIIPKRFHSKNSKQTDQDARGWIQESVWKRLCNSRPSRQRQRPGLHLRNDRLHRWHHPLYDLIQRPKNQKRHKKKVKKV